MQVSAPEPPAALPAAQSRPVAAGEGVRPLVLVHNFELQVLEGEIAHLRVVAAAVGEVAVQLLEPDRQEGVLLNARVVGEGQLRKRVLRLGPLQEVDAYALEAGGERRGVAQQPRQIGGRRTLGECEIASRRRARL